MRLTPFPPSRIVDEKQSEPPKAAQQKAVIATKVAETVKWFNVKSGYGFMDSEMIRKETFLPINARS